MGEVIFVDRERLSSIWKYSTLRVRRGTTEELVEVLISQKVKLYLIHHESCKVLLMMKTVSLVWAGVVVC